MWNRREATYTANSIIKTHNGDINLIGRSSGGTSGNLAIGVDGKDDKRNVFAATGSGSITLNGLALNTVPSDVRLTNVDLLAASGDIKIIAAGISGLAVGGYNIGNGLFVGEKAGSLVPSSISNIQIQSNALLRNKPLTIATTGSFVLEPYSTSFTNDLTFPISNVSLSNTISGLTLGKASNTSNIIFGSATSIAGPITAFGNTIAINGTLTATNNDIILHATGNVTQTAAITANGLGLYGTGTFTLNNASNNFATISGGNTTTKLGSLSFTDATGGLTIGTVSSNSGIATTGTILVETLSGNITLASNVLSQSTSANAIIFNAGKNTAIGTITGGDIFVSGTPTVSTGANGIAKLFSGSNGFSTGLTSLVGGTSNVRYEVDETTTTFSPSLQNGTIYALYRELTLLPPTASNQSVCSGARVSDLVATGQDLKWYDVAEGGTALALNSIVVPGTYYVSQTVNGTESARTSVVVSVTANIGSIGRITGTRDLASDATTATFTIPVVSGATSYVWNLPSGMTRQSQTGNSITVAIAASFTSGTISVYAQNDCGEQLHVLFYNQVNRRSFL